MILDTLLEVYKKEGLSDKEAMNMMAEDAMRGRRIRKQED
jgi:hypothetical protein